MSSWISRAPTPPGNLGKRPRPASRFCEVGWLVDDNKAGFIYSAPKALSKRPEASTRAPNPDPKGVNVCPAVLEIEAKTFEVPCPFDLRLKLGQDKQGRLAMTSPGSGQGSINKKHLGQLVVLLTKDRWRHPRRPVVQIITPYRFVTDEPVWINQMPPYDHYFKPAWPGLLLGGRYPADVWPRQLMFAFEWHDINEELVINRGDPWFYIRFDTADPMRPIRVVEAEMTPELRQYCTGLDGVTNYVNQTWKLFAEARTRRPETLLQRPKRGR
ncbi:hypothetical protein ACTL6U_12865 [Rhodovibrionaceae bacterium A322]